MCLKSTTLVAAPKIARLRPSHDAKPCPEPWLRQVGRGGRQGVRRLDGSQPDGSDFIWLSPELCETAQWHRSFSRRTQPFGLNKASMSRFLLWQSALPADLTSRFTAIGSQPGGPGRMTTQDFERRSPEESVSHPSLGSCRAAKDQDLAALIGGIKRRVPEPSMKRLMLDAVS